MPHPAPSTVNSIQQAKILGILGMWLMLPLTRWNDKILAGLPIWRLYEILSHNVIHVFQISKNVVPT